MRLKINIVNREGFTPEMTEKHKMAASFCERAVNSKDFHTGILKANFTNALGLTNKQIYERLMTGAETLDPAKDYEADISVVAYYQNNRVVGYTYERTEKTYVNTKFFSFYNYAEVAANMFHEWTHKVGFDHSSATDYDSVPYFTGYLVEELVNRMLKGEQLEQMDDSVPPSTVPETTPIPEAPQKPERVLICYRSWRTLWRKKCYYENA